MAYLVSTGIYFFLLNFYSRQLERNSELLNGPTYIKSPAREHFQRRRLFEDEDEDEQKRLAKVVWVSKWVKP